MEKEILSLFSDKDIVKRIKERLSYLFQLAEMENSRDGKLGMEIGSARERAIIGLLIYKFGEKNVKTNITITKPEIDTIVFNEPISIKTVTGKKILGVKLIWTVDSKKALEFSERYFPSCDIILAHIDWNDKGHLYYFTKNSQIEVLENIGRLKYIKLPKEGTNSRGVEISKMAIEKLSKHKDTKK